MKRPPLPYLLELPLLAVLLFGNCGRVRNMLREMGKVQRDRLQAIVLRRTAERTAVRQRLRDSPRQEAYQRIEKVTDGRIDSLIRGSEQAKFYKRRNKVELQLRRLPSPPSPR